MLRGRRRVVFFFIEGVRRSFFYYTFIPPTFLELIDSSSGRGEYVVDTRYS